jgi:hypothetical protein
MNRNEYGACASWWDPLGNGACAHCGMRKWRHDPEGGDWRITLWVRRLTERIRALTERIERITPRR